MHYIHVLSISLRNEHQDTYLEEGTRTVVCRAQKPKPTFNFLSDFCIFGALVRSERVQKQKNQQKTKTCCAKKEEGCQVKNHRRKMRRSLVRCILWWWLAVVSCGTVAFASWWWAQWLPFGSERKMEKMGKRPLRRVQQACDSWAYQPKYSIVWESDENICYSQDDHHAGPYSCVAKGNECPRLTHLRDCYKDAACDCSLAQDRFLHKARARFTAATVGAALILFSFGVPRDHAGRRVDRKAPTTPKKHGSE